MEEVAQIGQLLNQTLSSDGDVVRTATEALDRFSRFPRFPFSLLSIATGGENQGQRVAAATYLKNFTRRNIEGVATNSNISKEFKNQLMRDLLRIEPAVLKVLLEVLRVIVDSEFVKQNSWPELVPELQSAIQSSNLSNNGSNLEWNTVNALMVLHAVIRPFQYFLDPKVAKEPVPPQLELIAKEILVPLLTVLHHLVEKALAARGSMELEMEKVLLIICKCVYFAVRSHMPSALAPLLPSFCRNLIAILGSLNFDCGLTPENGYLLRLKTGKRSLLIFCALVTRHRKYSDKLTPDIINCALKIANYSSKISKLHFLSERIVSLALDMVSHVLETGRGWRLVSPHFSYLLDSAIFPALMLNEKDISDWEEDAAEYIRKNLPSELEEISGWREDLFTVRKSAINLLGIISVSKGPPVATSIYGSSVTSKRKKGERNRRNDQRASMGELLVLPFLSKFPNPSHINRLEARIFIDYFGVLMAYGGLQDFLREQNPGYTTTLIRTRVLPLYDLPECPPYLVASANWVLGELASCLPEEMNVDVYTSLLKALAMPDNEGCSCFPVRVSAAGAITALLENEYSPPEWLPLLQVVIGRIGNDDDQNIILFRLLSSIVEAGNENVAVHIPYVVSSLVHAISKCMHPSLDPWPEVVEKGFEALAVMSETWQNSKPEEVEQNKSSEMWARGQAVIAKALSALLQQAWLTPVQSVGGEVAYPSSCIDQPSTLLHCIMLSVTNGGMIVELKLSELLLAWADLIADWHAWEESEDLSIFDCIKEVVNLHGKYGLKNFIVRQMPSPPAPPVSQRSIIEGLSTFVSEAILKYPSATWRACSCIHILLHVPSYSFETDVKQALVVIFCHAAFSRFREICDKPCPLWKPLLLAVSSCYLCCPDVVEKILEENGGFAVWVSSLASLCTSTFEPGLSMASETKLVVMTLVKVVEHLLGPRITSGGLLRDCFISLMEASVRLKEVQNQMEDEGVTEDGENDDEEDEDDAEDSESDEREETEEEFLERYAKAAVALENGMDIEEGDLEDQEHEIELGSLAEADQERVVLSLMERYHHVLIQGHALPAELISSFVHAFPGYSLCFAPSC